MFSNYANQIYTQLIQQDYNPFAKNLNDDLTDDTMALGLIKVTADIVYIINILNAYNYKPDVLIGKTMIEREEFVQKYSSLNIKCVNIFLSENDEACKNYIAKIDVDVLERLENIYWSVSIDQNANTTLYASKFQPNKLMGIERTIKSLSTEKKIKETNIKHITARAIYESPLRAKFSFFRFYNILILINTAVFFIIYASSGINYDSLLVNGAFSYERIVYHREYYRLFTCMFLHGSFSHLFNNMFTLYIFGRSLENTTSHTNFLATYFLSGLAANTVMLLFPSTSIMVGASGCIFGLIGATLVLTFFFNKSIFGLNFTSIFTIAMINIFISIMSPEISLSVHLLGFIFGIIIGLFYAIDVRNSIKNKIIK